MSFYKSNYALNISQNIVYCIKRINKSLIKKINDILKIYLIFYVKFNKLIIFINICTKTLNIIKFEMKEMYITFIIKI